MITDGEEQLWSHMTGIERVRYIHARFVENNERKSFEFKRECAMQLRMKGFGRRDDPAVLTAHDNYFQLAYRTGEVWQCVETIFDMWNKREVKGQKGQADMHLSEWRHMQGLYDDAIVLPVLQRVVSKELSLQEMGREFVLYKMQHVVQQAFVKALDTETWQACKETYEEHATDDIVKSFIPVFEGWKGASVRKRRPWNAELMSFPDKFNAHIQQAQSWLQGQQRTLSIEAAPGDEDCLKFDNPKWGNVMYKVHNSDARSLQDFVSKRDYVLCLIDMPYGSSNSDCLHDDSAWSVDDFRRCVQSFKSVTTASLWRIIVLHAIDQREAVKTVLLEECNGGIQDCIWVKTRDKENPDDDHLYNRFECFMIGFFKKDAGRSLEHLNFEPDDARGDVVECSAIQAKLKHPVDGKPVNIYQKPRGLLNWMIGHFSYRKEWVLDLCSGSGTGLASALGLGRHCVSVELDTRQASILPGRVSVVGEDLLGEREDARTETLELDVQNDATGIHNDAMVVHNESMVVHNDAMVVHNDAMVVQNDTTEEVQDDTTEEVHDDTTEAQNDTTETAVENDTMESVRRYPRVNSLETQM